MTQYPNEKAPHSDWVNPPDAPLDYTSRDGAPASSSQPPQEYYPPPPDYGYAVTHPGSRPPNDHKQSETVLAPPTDSYGVPTAGPSTLAAPAQDEHVSLGSFFGPKGNPESWNRQPPPQLPYNAFPPMRLISNGDQLSKGFPELPPPCQLNPHPFSTHDVAEDDWRRFLADVKKAGSLSPGQRIKSNVIPLVTGMSFFTGFLATMSIEKRMKYKNRSAAGDLVDHWNHYFFGPRRMEVILSQASQRLSGKLGPSPFADEGRGDSSEDSSSEDEHGHGGRGDRHARKAARRERRAVRRAAKAERREWKARGDNKQSYELIITSI